MGEQKYMTEENNSFEDYLAGKEIEAEPEEQTDDIVPPIKVINETRYMDEELGRLLLEIYDRESVTVEELSEHMDRPVSTVNRQTGQLRKQGYLGVEHSEDEKQYFVSSDWGTQEFPSGPIIPLVYQFNLLSDTQRLEGLKKAIETTVEPGDVVADLGAGVGVLSCLAARTAEKVYAVEMDREVYEKGVNIAKEQGFDNIEYIRGDAREVELSEEVDVVMCELLDTALIAELQVPVMNYAVENLLAGDGDVIPVRARTSVQLVETDYEFVGCQFPLPHFEEYGSRESTPKSEPVVYHDINFNEKNSEFIEEQVTIPADETGRINGLQLNTDVQFGEDTDFTGHSPWLNAPLTLPLKREVHAEQGESLTVEISYELGGGLSNIVYNIVETPDE